MSLRTPSKPPVAALFKSGHVRALSRRDVPPGLREATVCLPARLDPVLCGDEALDAFSKQRTRVRHRRVIVGAGEEEERIVLERLGRRAVPRPVLLELAELLEAFEQEHEGADHGRHDAAPSTAATTGIAAAQTICAIFSERYARRAPRLLPP